MLKQKYYVVWKGRKRGIFTTWEECEKQVKGYVGAKFKAFASRAEAERALDASYADYQGKSASSQKWLFSPVKPLRPAIVVDAACSGSPGPLEYQGVELESGKRIFKRGPYSDGTNNVGEFLAIVEAINFQKAQHQHHPIYSDSENAIGWVKAGKCNTKLKRTRTNTELFKLIGSAEISLHASDPTHTGRIGSGGIRILKWDTAAWGENPADFGRK